MIPNSAGSVTEFPRTPLMGKSFYTMNLWSSNRWGARVRRQGEETWIDLKKPFALVGSHPRCDVQLGDSKLPSVVYLVVACGDRIEVWPTCPLAFPIWGRVNKNHVLMVGKSRIQFYFKEDGESDFSHDAVLDDDSADVTQDSLEHAEPRVLIAQANKSVDSEVSEEPEPTANTSPTAKLILDWGRGPTCKSLNRNVSILGEDHPSLIRLHSAELQRCDHGVVCFGDDVWLIDLHPERLNEEESIIRRVRPGERSVTIGGIHVWVQGDEPVALERLLKTVPSGNPGSIGSRYSQGRRGNPSPIRIQGHDHEKVPEIEQAASAPTVDPACKSKRESSLALISDDNSPRRTSAVELTSADEAESITMELTDRLLETNARKSMRRRILKISAISALVLTAIATAVAVIALGVMPIIRSIYGT